MSSEFDINCIIGEKVIFSGVKEGVVQTVEERKGNYNLVVSYEENGIHKEKTFKADIAIPLGAVAFFSKETQENMLSFFFEKEETKKNHDKKSRVTQNEYTQELINAFLDKKTISTLLVEKYGDAEYEKDLLNDAFTYLERVMDRMNIDAEQSACIVVALALIALECYDGDLHTYIEEKYRETRPLTEERFARSKLQAALREVLKDYRTRTKYFDKDSYVAVPIVLCGVPHYRVPDLFRLSYDIYKKRLLFDEDITDDQIKEKVGEILSMLRRKDLVGDFDVIKGTDYLMSKYTQSCIYSGVGIEGLINIITNCIRYIIYHLTRPEESFVVKEYYSEGYTKWTEEFDSNENEKRQYEQNRSISSPFFKLIKDRVLFYTGTFVMDDAYNPQDVHICVYSGEELIKDHRITSSKSIVYNRDESLSGYRINPCLVELDQTPLENLNYSIVVEGEKIYNSKKRLYRTVLFFDGKGNEVKPGTDYSGEVLVVTKTSNTDLYEDRIIPIQEYEDYYVSAIDINSEEVFYFDNEPFVFHKITGTKQTGYCVPWMDFLTVEGKTYPIYTEVSSLFPAACGIQDIIIEIDEEKYTIEDQENPFSLRLFSNRFDGNWIYSIKFTRMESGLHRINIINSITGKRVKGGSFEIVCDPTLWKSFVAKNDKGILYDLTCDFLDESRVIYEYGIPKKSYHTFVKNLGYGELRLYPSSISYSLDGVEWFDIDKKICLSDVDDQTNELFICGPVNTKAYYYDKDAPIPKQEANLHRNEGEDTLYKLSLDYLKTLQGKARIKIYFEYGNRAKYFTVSYNPYVLSKESIFSYNEATKTHYFCVRYEGKSTVLLTITPLNSDERLLTKEIYSGELVELKNEEIPDGVLFLTVALYGKKYNSLFSDYQENAFFKFPKYCIKPFALKVRLHRPQIEYSKAGHRITVNMTFEGAKKVLLKIIPTGFNNPVFEKKIKSGEYIEFETDIYPFAAYTICLYSNKSVKEDADFEDSPFFVSRPIETELRFIKETYDIAYVIIKNTYETFKIDYKLYFAFTKEIQGKYYLVAKLADRNGNYMDNMLVTDIEKEGQCYKGYLRKLSKEDKITRISFKGKPIDKVVFRPGGYR